MAQSGNVSQSAQALGISQPTLSRHIAKLEEELSVALFERHHRPMRLTDAGAFFYERMAISLADMTQTISMTQNFYQPKPNVLTIGFVASILYGRLPTIVAMLKQNVPELDVRLVEIGSEEQPQALQSGQIDVGFGRFLYQDHFVHQRFLRQEKLVVAMLHTHLLADMEVPISLSQLVGESIILYHRTPMTLAPNYTQDPILHLFHQYHLYPKNTPKARDIQIALGLVSAGEGMTLVPESLSTVRSHQIAYLPLADHAVSPIYLNTLTTAQHPHISALLNAIHAVYDDKFVTKYVKLIRIILDLINNYAKN
ncbi:LysR family transcriptional regulator [Moraxella lacunata]|uniref:LysR family transcriptional regulator n=1 Tax=Moraxella lacunata TaxID=477 RepID=UPI003EE2C5D5